MSPPLSDDDDEIRSAEYVLGLMGTAERREVEDEIARDARMAERVALWQERLAPLADDIDEVAPPSRVWTRVGAELGFDAPTPERRRTTPPVRWWNDVRPWRWIGIGASVAAASLAAVVVSLHEPRPQAVAENYLVASLAPGGGGAHWIATVDVRGSRVVIVPSGDGARWPDRSTELWLIPPGQKPIALGVMEADRPTTLALSRDVLAQIAPKATLAVSVEPPGGSPTGQPTGPVVATGKVTGA
ncbi:anti-sigma factor [Paraburkholderia sp. HD33-4]|uniref:anti-sigma factor n=1 Tax=Paraburkholderia sp. HD33-4 TaxID=2883242 RepID=UPI001F2FA683|nr:anti-sigma factor [Paraburkholderia sp. HD33-4]